MEMSEHSLSPQTSPDKFLKSSEHSPKQLDPEAKREEAKHGSSNLLELIPEEDVIPSEREAGSERGQGRGAAKFPLMQTEPKLVEARDSTLEEQRHLLEHKEPAAVPETVHNLFQKNPYADAFTKADQQVLDEYKPIVQWKSESLESREKKREESEKDLQRKDLIRARMQKIGEAQSEAEQARLENYAERFDSSAAKDAVVLAEVGIEQLNEENDRLEELKALRLRRENEQHEKYRKELQRIEEESKDELFHRSELMRKQIQRNELESIEKTREKNSLIKGAFKRANTTLKEYLKESRQEVEIKYHDLSMAYKEDRHNLAGSMERPNTTAWKKSHQVVEVRVELVRCVKDKLPKGRYAILCSILDRIGGNVIVYGSHKSKKWRRITAPKTHSGEYHLTNLRFEKSLLMDAPPRSQVRPSMVYLFELFLLKSKEYSNDQVLGWGVFPLIDADFELNKGKFKVPLLFGPVDRSMDKYCDIEKAYRTNIDAWLCNLYFSVQQKDTLANPYSVQLILDEDTQSRYDKYLVDDTKDSLDRRQRSTQVDSSYTELPSKDYEMGIEEAPMKKISLKVPSARTGSAAGNQPQPEEKWEKLVKPKDFDQYSYHIPHVELQSNVIVSRKFRYIMDEALSDLGFKNAKSIDFWISLVVLILVLWIRAYLHSFGSWILLKMTGTPINEFEPMLYGLRLSYSTRNVGIIVGVILFGNLFNTLVFGFLILISWLLKRYLGKAPRLVYKFVAAYGLSLLFDFLLIAVVDICTLNWYQGEMFVLYTHYYDSQGSGVVGVFIIAFVYGGIFVLNAFILYNYLVFLHMEGRIIDIYSRVTANSNYFFIPLDNEVSARYLRWVVTKLKLENSMNREAGYTKHFAVTYHTVTDPAGNYRKDITYIAIYRKRDDGKLVLYRHFVKSGDGAICELEEGTPFTVDEHPLLEEWPQLSRKFLGSEAPSRPPELEEQKDSASSKEPTPADETEPFNMQMNIDVPETKKDDPNLPLDKGEPQVFLIKNDQYLRRII